MKVTQEKLPASQLGLEIELPPEMSKQAYDKKVSEFARTANIPGFRKGKVPRQILIQRLGASRIKMAVLEELIDEALRQAIDQEDINAIGNFQLRSSFEDLVQQFEPGKALTFSASVDVPPEVKIEDYRGLSVQAEEVKYDPSKVDEVLEDYRNRTATLIPVEDRPVQMGDVAIVDFSGQFIPAEGEEPIDIPGGSAQDFQLEVREGQFIPGFVEGVVGMSAGETKEINISFPKDYVQEDLAGKPATFSITVKEIKEKELPDLDDDFAQEISEFETLQELRGTLEKRYQEEAEDKTKQNKTSAILEELVKHITVELPESLIKRESDFLVSQTVMRLESQGLDIRKTLSQELLDGMRERARPEAIARLKRTLALGEIAKRESIQVDEDELNAKVKEFMDNYRDQNVDPQRVRQVFEDEILESNVIDWLEENGSVELVPEGTLSTEQPSTTDDTPQGTEVSSETSSNIQADSSELDTTAAQTIDVESNPVEEIEPEVDDKSEDSSPQSTDASDSSVASEDTATSTSSKKKITKSTSKSAKTAKKSTSSKKTPSKKSNDDGESKA